MNDTNRKNILSNLQADFEGYQFAVKRLLQEGKNNPRLNSAIKGVVGNIISVDTRFQTAIEIALGGSIQNIVTKDENDAKILINYLKESKLGRATFLPINAVKARTLSARDEQYLSMSGCLGVASKLVKTDAIYQPVIDSLLGATVVCDNLDNAVNIAKKSGYSFRIVTLEGDVLSPQGSMSGGSKKSNDSSLLGKENEIKNLAKNIEEKTAELKTAESQLDSYIAIQNKLNGLLQNESNELQDANNDYLSKNTKLENIKQNISSLEEDIFTIQSQIKIAESVIKDLEQKINSTDQSELEYAQSKAQADSLDDSTKTAYEELKQKRDDYQEKLMELKVKIASTEEKIKALDRDIETYSADIESTKASIERVKTQLDSQQKVYDEAISLNKSKDEDSETEAIRQN